MSQTFTLEDLEKEDNLDETQENLDSEKVDDRPKAEIILDKLIPKPKRKMTEKQRQQALLNLEKARLKKKENQERRGRKKKNGPIKDKVPVIDIETVETEVPLPEVPANSARKEIEGKEKEEKKALKMKLLESMNETLMKLAEQKKVDHSHFAREQPQETKQEIANVLGVPKQEQQEIKEIRKDLFDYSNFIRKDKPKQVIMGSQRPKIVREFRNLFG